MVEVEEDSMGQERGEGEGQDDPDKETAGGWGNNGNLITVY